MATNPIQIFKEQAAEQLKAALRAGKTGTKLLDDGENNVGNLATINPQVLPAGGPIFTTIPQPLANNARILNLTALSKHAQSITVVMTAALPPDAIGLPGPLTGIVEFGNGTQTTFVFFDVPVGPFQGSIVGGVAPATQPLDGGAVIQVPSSAIRAYLRYDNAFITPTVPGYAFGAPGSPSAIPAISGPLAPNPAPAPLRSKGFAAYFGKFKNRLYKTDWLFSGDTSAPVTFVTVDPQTANFLVYAIPPFAKSVQLYRHPQSAAMTLQLWNQTSAGAGSFLSRIDAEYAIAGGSVAPIIPIQGNQNIVAVKSATGGAGDQVDMVKLVYEIGF